MERFFYVLRGYLHAIITRYGFCEENVYMIFFLYTSFVILFCFLLLYLYGYYVFV